MKMIAKIIFLMLALLAGEAMAVTCTSNASGDWRDNVWTPSSPCNNGSSGPSAGSDVVIANGTNIKVDTNTLAAANVAINSGGTLRGNGGDTLSLTGNFTNNGTFTANGGAVAFIGTSQTITGNATFANLTVSASTVLTLAGNVTVTGTTNLTAANLSTTCPINYTTTLANGSVMNSCTGGGGGSGGTCVSVPTTIDVNGTPVAAPVVAGTNNLSVGNNSYITDSAGTLNTSGNGTSMTTTSGVGPPGQTLPAFSPTTFPSVGGSNTTINNGTLAAGSYGDVTIKGSSAFSGGDYYISELKAGNSVTLTLAAGDYFIDKWDVGNDFVLNVSSGPVRIFINTSFQAGNQSVFNSPGSTANLQFYAYNNAQMEFGNANNGNSDVDFNGLIYAPGSNTQIKFGNNNIIQGAVLSGGDVQLGNNTGVIFDAATQAAIASISLSGGITCNLLDHIQIEHDGEGANCAAESMTVKACADAACSSLATIGGITATLQPFGTAVSIGASGSATVTVNSSSIGDNTLNATSISPAPANVTPVTCLNTAANSASCSMLVSACSFNCLESGLVPGSARLYTKLAGTPFSFDVVVLNSSGAVETNYVASGGTAKNVAVELVDGSGATACASRTAISPAVSQSLTFAAGDAGRKSTVGMTVSNAYANLRCRVTDATGFVGCSSDNFSVRPQKLILSTTTALNPITPSTDKLAAGEDFNLTADPGVTIGYTGTPAVNTASVVDHVTPTPNAVNTAELTWSNSSSTAASGFPQAAGGSVSNNFQYLDVGTITFNADAVTDSAYTVVDQSNDCVTGSTSNTADINGKFGCTIGSSALGPLGRFYPHHFAVNASFTSGCAGGFTYMDNDTLGLVLNITAQNKTNSTTTRYVSSPANTYVPVATLDVKLLNGTSATNLLSRLTQPTLPVRNWTLGGYSADGTYRFDARNATTPVIDGPYDSLKTQTTITDATDSVKITKLNGMDVSPAVSSIDSPTTTRVRFGRLSLGNAFGSELIPLSVPLKLEYYSSATQGWQPNTLDTCTTIAANNFAFSFPASATNNLAACETAMTVGGNAPNQTLTLTNPGAGNTGWSDITLNLGAAALGTNTQCVGVGTAGGADVPNNMPWLQSTGLTNPSARATFGIYKGNSHFIYFREIY